MGTGGPAKFCNSSSNSSRAIQQRDRRMRHFRPFFFKFDNCQPEVVSDVISGMPDHDVGIDVCANFVILD